MTVDDSDPQTLLIIAVTVLVFALVAFGLARLARRLPAGVPTALLAPTCASFLPLVLGGIGFSLFVGDEDFVDWITSRAPRAYWNMGLLFGAGLLAAWLGLRKRRHVVDISAFD